VHYSDDSSTDVSMLVHLASGNHEAAWQQFLDRYIKLLIVWCRYWKVEPVDVDEVVQETVLAVVKGFKDFQRQGEGSFRAWLKTISRNCWKRVSQSRERALGIVPEKMSGESLAGLARNPLAENHLMQLFDEWATRELLDLAFDRVRHRVDERTWLIYSLTTFEHQSVEQAAAQLDLSLRQVYDGIFRVRRMIRQEMAYLDP
jgi:RNA polymerase sigma factor (sigma-70 family)